MPAALEKQADAIDSDLAAKVRDGNQDAIDYVRQAQKLAHLNPGSETAETGATHAVEAKYVTSLDPVLETAQGQRLPGVPIVEADRLNDLRARATGRPTRKPPQGAVRHSQDGTAHGARISGKEEQDAQHPLTSAPEQSDEADAPLRNAIPPAHTNPLFPPLPLYGPASFMRTIQCRFFQFTSFWLSLGFLIAIVIGAIFDGIPKILRILRQRAMLQDPRRSRPFYEEEIKRKQERRVAEKAWVREEKGIRTPSNEKGLPQDGEFVPTEGGPDPLVVDVAYYARRVGLDAETYEVQTEDGFIIELWHIFNPREYTQQPEHVRKARLPEVFYTKPGDPEYGRSQSLSNGRQKYPVLMMHGLLQCSGAFATHDDDSFAFYLAKSGYDVWLGNNRCGFKPKHTSLEYSDPRMWAWNIRQMGVLDLAALVSRVLAETGFPKLALIAHSQGTTQAFVALAKEQRPEIGARISVFCALAPAAYAGPLINKMYFRFMQFGGAAVFRLVFGIHAFIPLMMDAHSIIPARFYGWLGYHVFSFLFSWSDTRWERDFRDRSFQWAPVYVSAESMRWWLGRDGFATQHCILATRQVGEMEDREDDEDDEAIRRYYAAREEPHVPQRRKLQRNLTSFRTQTQTRTHQYHDKERGRFAWYDEQFPPLALWVCGADDLVDGRRLLRRFDRGREPHVKLVHTKILEGYEHLDVIWAMDAIEKVAKEIREVIWRTTDADAQKRCRVPVGCERPLEQEPTHLDVPMLNSAGRKRMASISELGGPPQVVQGERVNVMVDASRNPGPEQRRYEESREEAIDAGAEPAATDFDKPSEGSYVDVREKPNPFG